MPTPPAKNAAETAAEHAADTTKNPPPFSEEADRADAGRASAENRRIDAEEARSQDEKAAQVDRVHGLAR